MSPRSEAIMLPLPPTLPVSISTLAASGDRMPPAPVRNVHRQNRWILPSQHMQPLPHIPLLFLYVLSYRPILLHMLHSDSINPFDMFVIQRVIPILAFPA